MKGLGSIRNCHHGFIKSRLYLTNLIEVNEELQHVLKGRAANVIYIDLCKNLVWST